MPNTSISPNVPDPRIDAAICDLIQQIGDFSDEDFDAQWLHLTEAEVVELVILLVQDLSEQLNGKVLGQLLLKLRENVELHSNHFVDTNLGNILHFEHRQECSEDR
jgi:hypothetical protein